MRELIAELPALSVAIPAISIALPIFSVLLLSAIFHWIFEPDNTQEETPEQDLDAADIQNFAINDAKSSADNQLSANRQVTDFSRQTQTGERADFSKTSTSGGRLKVRSKHEHGNLEHPSAHRQTDLPTPGSSATPETERYALTTMRLNTSTAKPGIEQPSESTTQASNAKGSTTRSATTSDANNAFHAEKNGLSSANNQHATHLPASRNSAQQHNTDDNTGSTNTAATKHNPNTNQDGELRVTLSTARPPSSKATRENAPTADVTSPTKASATSSSATATIDNQIDSTRTSFANSFYLDLDKTKLNRSHSAGTLPVSSERSSAEATNSKTENTSSGTTNRISPIQNHATTSGAISSEGNAPNAHTLLTSNTDSPLENAVIAPSVHSTTNNLNDLPAKEHQGDLTNPQNAAPGNADQTKVDGTTTNSSSATTSADIDKANSQSTTSTAPSTENNNAGAPTIASNSTIDSSDSTHSDIVNSIATPADQSNPNHGNLSLSKHADQDSKATTEAEKSFQTAVDNQQTKNASSGIANKHSPVQNYGTTSETAGNKGYSLTNTARTNNNLNSPHSSAPVAGSITTTSSTIKNESTDVAGSNGSPANHLHDSSAKEHQGDLAESQETDSSGIDKTQIAGAPTNNSAAAITPTINNTNSQSASVTTPATEDNKVGPLTTAGNGAIDSSKSAHQDATNNNLTSADQSNPSHGTSSVSKHADQNHSANSEAGKSFGKTRTALDSTTQVTSANTNTSTHHEQQPGQSDTSRQSALQTRLHGDKNTTQTDSGPATNAPLSTRPDQPANKHKNSTARGPSRSPERPKYQTAAKARYIPASVEAQLQLKTPSTVKTKDNGNNSVTQSDASNASVDIKLLAEKDRLIEELEAKLKSFQQQAGTSKASDHRPSPTTDSNNVAPSTDIHGVINTAATSTAQPENATLSNIDSAKSSSTGATPGNTNTADKLASTQPKNSQQAHAPTTLLAAVKTSANYSQDIQFKDSYEKATEKLALNEHKIEKLQLTINRLQASGLVELQNEPQVPHGRKTLLSKVRVMAPAG